MTEEKKGVSILDAAKAIREESARVYAKANKAAEPVDRLIGTARSAGMDKAAIILVEMAGIGREGGS